MSPPQLSSAKLPAWGERQSESEGREDEKAKAERGVRTGAEKQQREMDGWMDERERANPWWREMG